MYARMIVKLTEKGNCTMGAVQIDADTTGCGQSKCVTLKDGIEVTENQKVD